MNSLPWIKGHHGNDIGIVDGAARSYQTCVIYFVNFIEQKDETSFLKLVRLIYLTLTNVLIKKRWMVKFSVSLRKRLFK